MIKKDYKTGYGGWIYRENDKGEFLSLHRLKDGSLAWVTENY